MNNIVFVVLVLLFIKHFVVDFIMQTDEQVRSKGIYLDWPGVVHSMQHGVGTFLIFFMFTDVITALLVGIIDFGVHYHVDWSKININKKYNYTPADKQFWVWLGADQLAHSLTYVWLVWSLS